MKLDHDRKALFLIDIDNRVESVLQEVINIRSENMITIQCYGPVISNPFGDIMRSVIIAICQEHIEEIFVVGTENKRSVPNNVLTQLGSMKDKLQTLDYLFQNTKPEFSGTTINEWLNLKEDGSKNVEKCVNIIQHHPLVPSHVKVRGLMVKNKNGKSSIVELEESDLLL